jgi:DNA-binding NarL/FixJ family response regulator
MLAFPSAPDNSLAQFLQLSQRLHAYSDEELHAQLHQLAFGQPEHLVPVLRLLLHNGQYLQQHLGLEAAAAAKPVPVAPPKSPLSSREQEIAALLAQGYTLPQIGEQLFISPATVNNHCARMREKLGLQGRNSLITYAINGKG